MTKGNWTGWTEDVANSIRALGLTIGDHFSLAQIYQFESLLHKLHPSNNHIQAKIRQQLQVLQDLGYVSFINNKGLYQLVKEFPDSES